MKVRQLLPLLLAASVLAPAELPAQSTTQTSRTAATQQRVITIPSGAEIQVRINERITSATAQAGDPFTGVLYAPIVVNGQTLFPAGAQVIGTVMEAESSGRLQDPGMLKLQITTIRQGTRTARFFAQPFETRGESHTRGNVTKIGGGAALGAIIGGIAGGGKGAAIGTVIGAAGGTGAAAATGRKEAIIESEAILAWTSGDPELSGPPTLQTRGATTTQSTPQSTPQTAATTPAGESSSAQAPSEQRPALARRAPDAPPEDYTEADIQRFSRQDRMAVRQCMGANANDLPPGLAKRDRLPPGLEQQLQRNGKLPPGLEKRVSYLPRVCERQLTQLPRELDRVIYGDRVMLINQENLILDYFDLDLP